MRRAIETLIIIVMICLSICSCTSNQNNSNTIDGTWVIQEYELSGETVSTEGIFAYFGNETTFNSYMIIFSPDGRCEVSSSLDSFTCSYTVDGSVVSLFESGHEDDVAYLSFDGQKIKWELFDDFVMVFSRTEGK